MNIHEYQAKQILEKYGIPVPEFFVISNLKELENFLEQRNWQSGVLKAQIHAGGRGKGGGVKIAKNPQDFLVRANELLGKKIVTTQTDSTGLIVNKLLISQLLAIEQEYYLGITIDRKRKQIVLLASPVGGIDIEEVAKTQPEKVLTLSLPPFDQKFRSYHLLRLANFMGWNQDQARQGIEIVKALVKAFIELDGSLLEINPLVKTSDGKLTALDAKFVVDENALYRQPALKEMFDSSQINPMEAKAQSFDLSYVALDGEIGCMVNGAGLAMATMDIIQFYGGLPANFLDVGGGATKEKVAEGFKIILLDKKVKSVLVNIFGGIMNCETIAEGIIEAAKELKIDVPIVVRLEGTNVNKGKKLLKESGLNIISAGDLSEAAKISVKLSKESGA